MHFNRGKDVVPEPSSLSWTEISKNDISLPNSTNSSFVSTHSSQTKRLPELKSPSSFSRIYHVPIYHTLYTSPNLPPPSSLTWHMDQLYS